MKYQVSGCADYSFPVVPYYGLLWYNKTESVSIPMDYPLCGRWGDILSANDKVIDDNPMPKFVSACWLSIREERFYFYETDLNQQDIIEAVKTVSKQGDDVCFVIGMGAMGKFSLWLRSDQKSVILQQGYGETTYVPINQFMPVRPDLSKKEFCDLMLSQINTKFAKSDYWYCFNADKQYNYRYNVLFERWDGETWHDPKEHDFQLVYIEDQLTDGTHDKIHDGGLLTYHNGATPLRIVAGVEQLKSKFNINIFVDRQIKTLFERFYGAHPETKTDFIIKIDAENKKYELALYRQGLKEPVLIPESAYQVIVFKNKFEDYRSENYNQPRGAWIW